MTLPLEQGCTADLTTAWCLANSSDCTTDRRAADRGAEGDRQIPGARGLNQGEGQRQISRCAEISINPRAGRRAPVHSRGPRTHLEALEEESRILFDMERPQTLANLWLILQTIAFVIALDGVAEYFSDRHYQSLARHLILLYYRSVRGLDHDPAEPKLPESWEEWYNS